MLRTIVASIIAACLVAAPAAARQAVPSPEEAYCSGGAFGSAPEDVAMCMRIEREAGARVAGWIAGLDAPLREECTARAGGSWLQFERCVYVVRATRYGMHLAALQSQIRRITQAVHVVYGSGADLTGLSVDALIRSGVFPAAMTAKGGLHHAFGGEITVVGYERGRYDVTFKHVPPDVCTRVAVSEISVDSVQLSIGSATFQRPPKANQAAQACGAAPVDLSWTLQ